MFLTLLLIILPLEGLHPLNLYPHLLLPQLPSQTLLPHTPIARMNSLTSRRQSMDHSSGGININEHDDRRIVVGVDDKGNFTNPQAPRLLSKWIKEHYSGPWATRSEFPMPLKNDIWTKFKETFRWPNILDSGMEVTFARNCGRRVSACSTRLEIMRSKTLLLILNTRSKLVDIGVVQDSTCCICMNAVETIQHLFFQCPYSKACIEGLFQALKMDLPCLEYNLNLTILQRRRGPCPEFIAACVNCIMHMIWLERNNCLWNGCAVHPLVTARKCLRLMLIRLHSLNTRKANRIQRMFV